MSTPGTDTDVCPGCRHERHAPGDCATFYPTHPVKCMCDRDSRRATHDPRKVTVAEREEWKALAEADTLHMLPTEALIASLKDLATRLLEVTYVLD